MWWQELVSLRFLKIFILWTIKGVASGVVATAKQDISLSLIFIIEKRKKKEKTKAKTIEYDLGKSVVLNLTKKIQNAFLWQLLQQFFWLKKAKLSVWGETWDVD